MAKKKGDRVGTEIKKMVKALNEETKIKKKGPTPEDIFRQMTGKDANSMSVESDENDFNNIPYKEQVVNQRKKESASNKKKKGKAESSTEMDSIDEASTDVEEAESEKEKIYDNPFDELISKKYKGSMDQFTDDKKPKEIKGKNTLSSEDESDSFSGKNKGKKSAGPKGKKGQKSIDENNKNAKSQKEQSLYKKEPTEEEFQGNKVWDSDMFDDDDVKKKRKPQPSYGTAEDIFRKRIEQRNSSKLQQNFGNDREDEDDGGDNNVDNDLDEEEQEEEEEDGDDHISYGRFPDLDDKVPFVSKSQWGGEPPRFSKPLEHPIQIIRLTYTGTDQCYDMEVCAPLLKQLQEKAKKVMNLPDLQWNFVISTDGTVYEGRGWNVEGYKNKDCRRKYGGASVLELGYMGNYDRNEIPSEMTFAQTVFLRQAVKKGYVEKMHTVTKMFAQ